MSGLACEFGVDDGSELLKRDGTVQEDAVDEECRRALDASLGAVLKVFLYFGFLRWILSACVPLVEIESEGGRMLG